MWLRAAFVALDIGPMTRLEILDISDNLLTALPKSLGACGNLVYLNASANKLSGLPIELSQASNLQDLNIANNRICGLPAEFSALTQLQVELPSICTLQCNNNFLFLMIVAATVHVCVCVCVCVADPRCIYQYDHINLEAQCNEQAHFERIDHCVDGVAAIVESQQQSLD
jgi:Leucine-rich repeat (LRR) protein